MGAEVVRLGQIGPSIVEALSDSLKVGQRDARGGALEALARAYAAEIDAAIVAGDGRAALGSLGPKLHAALTSLGLAFQASGPGRVPVGEPPAAGEAPEPVPAAAEPVPAGVTALDRLRGRARERGAG